MLDRLALQVENGCLTVSSHETTGRKQLVVRIGTGGGFRILDANQLDVLIRDLQRRLEEIR